MARIRGFQQTVAKTLAWLNKSVNIVPIINLESFLTKSAIYHKLPNGTWAMQQTDLQAGWFEVCDAKGLGTAVIANWEPNFDPWTPKINRMLDTQFVEKLLKEYGLNVAFLRTTGNSVLFYCCTGKVNGDKLFDDLGIDIDPVIKLGKVMKRMSVFSASQGAHYEDRPDYVGGQPLKVCVEHDRPEADGGMVVTEDFVKRACTMMFMEYRPGYHTRVQLWIATSRGLLKGLARVDRNQRSWDIKCPVQNIDHGFRMTKALVMKGVLHGPLRQETRMVKMDGLLRMPELMKHVDYTEVCQVQSKLLLQADDWDVRQLNAGVWADGEVELDNQDSDSWIVRKIEKRLWNEEVKQVWQASGKDLYLMPEILREATGRTYQGFKAFKESMLDDASQSVMPGMLVSAIRGYWTDAKYAGKAEPEPGYIGLLWNNEEPDGFMMSKEDVLSDNVKIRSDGGDGDDLLDGVLMKYRGQKLIWLVRNPTSWGGGWFLKVREDDWRRLLDMGYHAYKCVKKYEVPNMPKLLKEGVGLKIKT